MTSIQFSNATVALAAQGVMDFRADEDSRVSVMPAHKHHENLLLLKLKPKDLDGMCAPISWIL